MRGNKSGVTGGNGSWRSGQSVSIVIWPLFIITLAADYARSMRWVERKDVLAAIHGITVLGVVACAAFVIWNVRTGAEERAQDRANSAANAKMEVEAARAAEQACLAQRNEEIGHATKRRAEARRMLNACREDFEKSKTLFTSVSAEQRCRVRQTSLDIADRDYKIANTRLCAPSPKR